MPKKISGFSIRIQVRRRQYHPASSPRMHDVAILRGEKREPQGSPWPPPQTRRYDDRILPIPAMLVMPRTRVGQWEHAEGGSPVTKGGVNPFSPPLFRRPDRNREKEVPPPARPDSVNTLALLTPVLEHACTTCQQTRPPPSATSPHPLPLLAFG